jgi:hypothetical protein
MTVGPATGVLEAIQTTQRTNFVDLAQQHGCEPPTDTAYLRSDARPERTAADYLVAQGHSSNVAHLPVGGSGDGSAYTTVADVHRLWTALRAVLDRAAREAAWRPEAMFPPNVGVTGQNADFGDGGDY